MNIERIIIISVLIVILIYILYTIRDYVQSTNKLLSENKKNTDIEIEEKKRENISKDFENIEKHIKYSNRTVGINVSSKEKSNLHDSKRDLYIGGKGGIGIDRNSGIGIIDNTNRDNYFLNVDDKGMVSMSSCNNTDGNRCKKVIELSGENVVVKGNMKLNHKMDVWGNNNNICLGKRNEKHVCFEFNDTNTNICNNNKTEKSCFDIDDLVNLNNSNPDNNFENNIENKRISSLGSDIQNVLENTNKIEASKLITKYGHKCSVVPEDNSIFLPSLEDINIALKQFNIGNFDKNSKIQFSIENDTNTEIRLKLEPDDFVGTIKGNNIIQSKTVAMFEIISLSSSRNNYIVIRVS